MNTPELYGRLDEMASITSIDGEYMAFDTFTHKMSNVVVARDEKALFWALVKQKRATALRPLLTVPTYSVPLQFYLTDEILAACELVDRHATDHALRGAFPEILAHHRVAFLRQELEFEEAILSSQLEGAATTRVVAADMLRSHRKPRTESERMIVGNLAMINEAQQHVNAKLTPALIQAIHETGTRGIDDATYKPGVFRTTDDIAVQTPDGHIIHQPPPAEGLLQRLEALCAWFNHPSPRYTHPLVRAIALHFLIAHEHPFHDGNGRVARALFYWAMLRNGYGSFLYISISRYLKEAHAQYVNSFRRVQTDDMDLTYFLDAQCRIIRRGLINLLEYLTDLQERMKAIRIEWSKQPSYNALNDRQKHLLDVARSGITTRFRSVDLTRNFGIAANTALSDLNALVAAGFLEKRKEGREWVYTATLSV